MPKRVLDRDVHVHYVTFVFRELKTLKATKPAEAGIQAIFGCPIRSGTTVIPLKIVEASKLLCIERRNVP